MVIGVEQLYTVYTHIDPNTSSIDVMTIHPEYQWMAQMEAYG